MLVHPHSTDIKIIDFGFAKKFDPNQEYKVLAGTPEFSGMFFLNFVVDNVSEFQSESKGNSF